MLSLAMCVTCRAGSPQADGEICSHRLCSALPFGAHTLLPLRCTHPKPSQPAPCLSWTHPTRHKRQHHPFERVPDPALPPSCHPRLTLSTNAHLLLPPQAHNRSAEDWGWMFSLQREGMHGMITKISDAVPHRTRKSLWAHLTRVLHSGNYKVRGRRKAPGRWGGGGRRNGVRRPGAGVWGQRGKAG